MTREERGVISGFSRREFLVPRSEYYVRNGGIAQLAEHELCKLGVTGSNPVASTNTSAEQGTRNAERGKVPGFVLGVPSSHGRVAQLVRARP